MTEKALPPGCLGFFLSFFQRQETEKEKTEEVFPYEAVNVLTEPERHFFHVLRAAVQNRLLIFAKVRMEDIVEVKKSLGRRKGFGFRNRVKSKHFDFVLFSNEGLKTILVIELDGTSHNSESQRKDDAFKDDTLGRLGIPILRVKQRREYDKVEIFEQIKSTVENARNSQSDT